MSLWNMFVGGGRPDFVPLRDIPDLTGKVIFVTGGNAGIGYETVRELARHNPAHIYLTSRSLARGYDAVQRVKDVITTEAEAAAAAANPKGSEDKPVASTETDETNGHAIEPAEAADDAEALEVEPELPKVTVLPLHLDSFESIKTVVKTFTDVESRLDLLINNAGVMTLPEGTTEEGYEVQFGVNHVGHALLTHLLLPTMMKSGDGGRVVFLTSPAEELVSPDLVYEDEWIKTPTAGGVPTWKRYAISKAAVLQYARALSERYADKESGLTFVAVHPGMVDTALDESLREQLGWVLGGMFWYVTRYLFTITPEKGARNTLWVATSTDVRNGGYYEGIGKERKGSELSRKKESRDQLWEWTEGELRGHVPL